MNLKKCPHFNKKITINNQKIKKIIEKKQKNRQIQ